MPSLHLALLRGINVGGKNKLPMKELAAIFEKRGCGRVRTFIQSGNVIFTAAPKIVERLSTAVAGDIQARFGYRTPVILRTAKQLRDAVAANPFPGREENLYVMFLQDRPDQQQIGALDPHRSLPDRFEVRGAEIYLHVISHLARTKLTNAWFDSRLETVSTLRNWRTVMKLLEMMEE